MMVLFWITKTPKVLSTYCPSKPRIKSACLISLPKSPRLSRCDTPEGARAFRHYQR